MRKSFLIKTSLLIVLLAVVAAVINFLMKADFTSAVSSQEARQSFLEQFVISGGPIVWFVLLPMSVGMVFLAVEHCLTIRRGRILPADTGEKIIEAVRQSGIGKLHEQIDWREDFLSIAVAKAVTKGRGDWFRMWTVLAESLQEQAMGLLRKIEWLNLIGNVSPMVGLFGTVFGMIKLFNAIVVVGGQPQPAHLADGISVALVTTFWGLFIAIPALAVHGVFRNRIETLVSDTVTEADNVMLEIKNCLKRQAIAAQAGKSRSGTELNSQSSMRTAGKKP